MCYSYSFLRTTMVLAPSMLSMVISTLVAVVNDIEDKTVLHPEVFGGVRR
jgi:hypothetical protein